MRMKEYIIIFLVLTLLTGCSHNLHIEQPIGGDPELRRQMVEEIHESNMVAQAKEVTNLLTTYCLAFEDYEKIGDVDFFKEHGEDAMLNFVICLAMPSKEERKTYDQIGKISDDGSKLIVEKVKVEQILRELFDRQTIPTNFDSYFDEKTDTYRFDYQMPVKLIDNVEITQSEASYFGVKQTVTLKSADHPNDKTIQIEYTSLSDEKPDNVRISKITDITQ